ncbi:hypothetical protein OH764_02975 [Burkholderia sp. M6-3]
MRKLELVKVIQAEINRFENSNLHKSVVFGFDEAFLAKVHGVIGRFTLAPIDEYCGSHTAKRKRLRTCTTDLSTRCATALSPAGR